MGGSSYNFASRSLRTATYDSLDFDDTFTQQREGKMHESMDPKKALLRECRDNEHNPKTLPILIGLDVTGSMQQIPKLLITKGLPEMVAKLKEEGVEDPSILFTGLGDSTTDSAPLQVGQFECSDDLLDLWLTRTWIEGRGGANAGESYLWAWWFAANRIVTDHWEKRGQKGFIFTIGDEPCLPVIHPLEFQKVLGQQSEAVRAVDLIEQASEKWNIFHISVRGQDQGWNKLLGQRSIVTSDYNDVPRIIAETVGQYKDSKGVQSVDTPSTSEEEPTITL